MGKYGYILISVVFLGLFSCKKDKTPFPSEPAYNDLEHGWMDEPTDSDYAPPGTGIDNNEYYTKMYSVPKFNPNNPNELIFFYENYQENILQLIKYNLKTKEKKVLTNGMRIVGEPVWSKKGLVAFSHYPSYHIYVVKDNGTELRQVSDATAAVYPKWSGDGENLFWSYQAVLGQYGDWLRYNIINNTLDTIFGFNDPNGFSMRSACISPSNKLLSVKFFNDLSFYFHSHLLSSNFTQIIPFSTFPNYARWQCWAQDEEHFFVSLYVIGEIYKINSNTNSYELFRPQYNGNWIEAIDASPDGKYLVAQRIELSNQYYQNGQVAPQSLLKSKIQLIDLETKKIKILDLD